MLKKLFLMLCVMITLVRFTYGDVIDPNHHPVTRCVTIDSLDLFPDVAIIGLYSGPMINESVAYQVKPDSCLNKGYKFNSHALFWVTKSYLDEVGINGLPVDEMRAAIPALSKKSIVVMQQWGFITSEIEPYGGTVPDDNPLVSEELIYKPIRNGIDISIIAIKKVSHFDDGTQSIENLVQTRVSPANAKRKPTRLSVEAEMVKGYLLVTPNTTGKVDCALYDCNGKTVSRFSRTGNAGSTYLLPVSAGPGLYWLKVHGNGEFATLRINSLN